MFWKKKNKSCEHKSENKTLEEKTCDPIKHSPIRRIINGKLYDTSKAKNIYKVILSHDDIPNYDLPIFSLGGENVSIYKGNSEWFIEYFCFIEPVTEDWVKEIIGRCNPDKYIELFGEVEEA